MPNNTTYCDLVDFRNEYKNWHGYFSLTVCIFGSIANIFNICVLRTKQMRSPTNFILTGLALSDLLVMLEYIPFTIHRNVAPARFYYWHHSRSWAGFYMFHSLYSNILHSISTCLTIILAVWRYIYISKLQTNSLCVDLRKTKFVIVLTYLICPLLLFYPMFSTMKIEPFSQNCLKTTGRMILQNELHLYNSSDRITKNIFRIVFHDPYHFNILIYSILLRIVPCVLLSALCFLIIRVLLKTKRRKEELRSSCSPLQEMDKKNNAIHLCKENQAERTTIMLLAVLFLFLLTEFPPAIFGLIAIFYGNTFMNECYGPFGDIIDLMALINSAINFILYCTMSRQFRQVFQEIFRMKLLLRCFHVTQRIPEETSAETKMCIL